MEKIDTILALTIFAARHFPMIETTDCSPRPLANGFYFKGIYVSVYTGVAFSPK